MSAAQSLDITREIARRAYALWETEGRPHGRDRDHWARAERELVSERALAAAVEPEAPAAKKAARPRKLVAAAEASVPEKKPSPKAAAGEKRPARRSAKPA